MAAIVNRPDNMVTRSKAMEELLGFDDGKNRNEFFSSNKIRCCIVGPSGCGKTTFVMNRILEPGRMDWMQIKIMAPPSTLQHPSYQAFKEMIDAKQEAIQEKLVDLGYPYAEMCELIDVTDASQIPKVEDFKEGIKHIVIIDDFIAANRACLEKVNALVIYGSKRDMAIFLLVQNMKIPVLATSRRSCDSFIIFGGVPKSVFEEIFDFGGIGKKNIEPVMISINQKERNYAMIMLRAPPNRRIMLGEDKYYIPIECGNQTIRGGSIAGDDGYGRPNLKRRELSQGQSRYLCFKNREQWEILLRNHMLEYGIGNDGTPPYIEGLINAGNDLDWTSKWVKTLDGESFDNMSGQVFDALYIPDKNALTALVMESKKNLILYLSLQNFGADNGWLSKESVNRIMKGAMSKY